MLLNGCFPVFVTATCVTHNYCNAHGTCTSSTQSCSCYDGWGSDTDITNYRSPDCSTRVCPAGLAWVDVPTAATTAHALAECSNKGVCDRGTGRCTCFSGFEGAACERMACPSRNAQECSGHGVCVSMKRMATMTNALPLSAATTYTGDESATTWDENKIFGCVCDSSWTVGLGSGQYQQPEYFGPDCSLKRCPTGNDPSTASDETDCGNVVAEGGFGTGATGNLCHVDCSNRGICDYSTGICRCFEGYYSENCALISALATRG